ncbi:MAG: lysylphosphatidylglycerol synthase domain-containing protein [Actinomycetia bacterium]|nr:lysylphosphatidylglycerol synthase domain-containing protein [Actinomycetes bacterium]MCH9800944.1 lysylphosphatidylglycerol synthase domain-containing protein [Actinomycetes bacterium]
MTTADQGSRPPADSVESAASGSADEALAAPADGDATDTAMTEVIQPSGTATQPNSGQAVTPTPDSADGDTGENTLVIEDGVISKRLRRPMDLVRLVAAVAASIAVAALAYFATNATSSLGEEVSAASRSLPEILVGLLRLIGNLGLLALPVASAVDLLLRGRGRQLVDALAGFFLAVVLLLGAQLSIEYFELSRWQVALAGSTSPNDTPLIPLFGGLVAYITVARLMARRPWNAFSILVVVSLGVLIVTAGSTALAGLGLSVLVGWAAGLLTRYALGTPTTRPSGVKVAQTLERADLPVVVLRATERTGMGRMYLATRTSGPALNVIVLDRDLEGAGLIQDFWRSLRLREDAGSRSFNMRRTLEQRALLSYSAQIAGVATPQLLAAREVSADSCLLVYEKTAGRRLQELAVDEITDAMLDEIWQSVAQLRAAGIAHRALNSHNIQLDTAGSVELLRIDNGSVAASDVSLRIDLAELLCSLGLLVGADRAVASGRRVLGSDVIAKALPVLQPVALSSETKKAVRKNKDLLAHIRDALIEVQPDATVEQIELERIKPRTVLMIAGGTIAVYVLLSQLANVDLVGLFRDASWWWVGLAFAASLLTYPATAWQLSGFVPEKLKLLPTTAVQLAGDFVTLITPPTLGSVGVNMRYLTKIGIHPVLATASIGVSQVGAFMVHVLMLIGFGIAAGTQAASSGFSFELPPVAVIAVLAVLVVIVVLAMLRPVRTVVWKRIGPLMKEVVPRMVTVAQRPWKIVEGVGGSALVNVGYILCLAACVEAFGGELSLPLVALAYLAGSVIGQAAPTPGGLGAVEAAIVAGLTFAGLDAGIAVSSVLLYRVITFWLPVAPGYLTFNLLQRKGYL